MKNCKKNLSKNPAINLLKTFDGKFVSENDRNAKTVAVLERPEVKLYINKSFFGDIHITQNPFRKILC